MQDIGAQSLFVHLFTQVSVLFLRLNKVKLIMTFLFVKISCLSKFSIALLVFILGAYM